MHVFHCAYMQGELYAHLCECAYLFLCCMVCFDSVLSLVQHFVTSVLKVLTVDLPVALIYSYSIKEHACYSSCLFYL